MKDLARGRPVDVGALGLDRADRELARRVLRGRESLWHDGDENLVRGHLDAWSRKGEGPRDTARLLLAAARALLAASPPPAVLWFFLWEMETLLPSLAAARKRRKRLNGQE